MVRAAIVSALTLLLVPIFVMGAEDWYLVHPEPISKCLQRPEASSFEVMPNVQPYYLRGDFDGDGKADYAVAGRGKKTNRRGILICDGKARVFVLGADNPMQPAFSNLPNDNFVAGNWVVYSKTGTLELTKSLYNAPNPLPSIVGETIGMVFQDSTGLIYWDGRRYRWASPRE